MAYINVDDIFMLISFPDNVVCLVVNTLWLDSLQENRLFNEWGFVENWNVVEINVLKPREERETWSEYKENLKEHSINHTSHSIKDKERTHKLDMHDDFE